MLKRIIDIVFSFIGIIILLPLFLVISLSIITDSKGAVFYKQLRVGRNNKDFELFKFRSMTIGADKKGLLTVGMQDSRITKVGVFIRKYKLDELPQLINVLKGDMSLVGPRPEVRKYVDMYSEEQMKVLALRPGITDYASIEYSNENEILEKSNNPEKTYIEDIMPKKIELSLKYIEKCSIKTDLEIIFKTLNKIFS